MKSCLKVIFQNNVMRFEGGFMGAVNGMRANGVVSCFCLLDDVSAAQLMVEALTIQRGWGTTVPKRFFFILSIS